MAYFFTTVEISQDPDDVSIADAEQHLLENSSTTPDIFPSLMESYLFSIQKPGILTLVSYKVSQGEPTYSSQSAHPDFTQVNK